MVLNGCKRQREQIKGYAERENTLTKIPQCVEREASISAPTFPLLELPYHILCDIFSRLPLLCIIRCRCICKTLLGLLKDPYFCNLHLTRAPTLTTNLILEENVEKWGSLHFFTVDLRESTLASSSSDNQHPPCYFKHGLPTLSRLNAEFSFRTQRFSLVGSCNGLLCLYFNSPKSFYYICNPLLGEYVRIPSITASSPVYTYANHSGFGYCPTKKQYKVINFMYLAAPESKHMVANVNTLGSDSWRRIEHAPFLERNSFDPFLNGALHWITNSSKPSELISSFDLEKETFKNIPPPAHFNVQFLKKLAWMNIGVLRGCICICYIYNCVEFEVWVMKEYGVKESWIKDFSIDLNFYCKLQVEDLRRPLKFLSNGDLWFISSSESLVSFSPQKRTFRELRSLDSWLNKITAHDLSFLSLRDVAGVKRHQVRSLKIVKRRVELNV